MIMLPKQLINEITGLNGQLSGVEFGLQEAAERYNERTKRAWNRLIDAAEKHNEVINRIELLKNNAVSYIENYMSNQPDGWLDTLEGRKCCAWRDEWIQANFDKRKFDPPKYIANSEVEYQGTLTDLSIDF